MKKKFKRLAICLAVVAISVASYSVVKAQVIDAPSVPETPTTAWGQTTGRCGNSINYCCTQRPVAFSCRKYACTC